MNIIGFRLKGTWYMLWTENSAIKNIQELSLNSPAVLKKY
jgi:hypothetical protein